MINEPLDKVPEKCLVEVQCKRVAQFGRHTLNPAGEHIPQYRGLRLRPFVERAFGQLLEVLILINGHLVEMANETDHLFVCVSSFVRSFRGQEVR